VFYGIVVTDASHRIADNDSGFRTSHRPPRRRHHPIAPENTVACNRISAADAITFSTPRAAPGQRRVDSRYGLHDTFSDETVIARNTFADSVVGANMNSRRIDSSATDRAQSRRAGDRAPLKDCDDSVVADNGSPRTRADCCSTAPPRISSSRTRSARTTRR
jgi:hypothetical protein